MIVVHVNALWEYGRFNADQNPGRHIPDQNPGAVRRKALARLQSRGTVAITIHA
jgi:hypothetical protein